MQLLRDKNIFLEIKQSEKMKSFRSQEQRNQKSFPEVKDASSKKQQENSVNNTNSVNESFDLDKLILCAKKQSQKEIVLNLQETLLLFEKSRKLPSQSFVSPREFQSKHEQLEKEISSGILKLQSDQAKKQTLDIKLQDEEIAIIQEDIRSNQQTVKYRGFVKQKNWQNNGRLQRKNELFRNNLQQECIQYRKQLKFQESKKFIMWFIVILFVSILVAGTFKINIPKKHKRFRK